MTEERIPFVIEVLEERPICECCWSNRSTDVHELLSRARGGDMLDKDNVAALCRDCHSYITQNPAWAEANGWALSKGPQ